MTKIENGAMVNYEYTLDLSAPRTFRGVGRICGTTIVGTSDAYVIQVTESSDNELGEYIHVRAIRVWRARALVA
ncbi:hypothetical protein ABXK61_16215 [Burkholderia sola]|uniref:hypothetical protein n=1 Tax=Burkholderia TaxID=32008 RepID=UPI001AE486F3|nr:hypothetical protein [Burkholderia sp. AcTa6-5]MBP0714851.1 hypothetical protein [Burkholderia sp. AcTa6-5]